MYFTIQSIENLDNDSCNLVLNLMQTQRFQGTQRLGFYSKL